MKNSFIWAAKLIVYDNIRAFYFKIISKALNITVGKHGNSSF